MTDRMPDQLAQLNGFAGHSAVLTTWGACRLHDLARLTQSRDSAAVQWQARIEALQARPNSEDAVAKAQADCAADLAVRLPLIIVDTDTQVECLGVVLVGTTTDIVDVTISQVEVGEPPSTMDMRVRCGSASLFVTDNGNVPASAVDGETLHLYAGTFVASVNAVQPSEPVALYRVLCAADTHCIGVESIAAARVCSVV